MKGGIPFHMDMTQTTVRARHLANKRQRSLLIVKDLIVDLPPKTRVLITRAQNRWHPKSTHRPIRVKPILGPSAHRAGCRITQKVFQTKASPDIFHGDTTSSLHDFGVELIRMCQKAKDGRVGTAPGLGVAITSASWRTIVLIEFIGAVSTVSECTVRDNVGLASIIPDESSSLNAVDSGIRWKSQWFSRATYCKHIIDPKPGFQCLNG
mmetsp:Transcript_11819/g.24272  ORF Transcript_11819/g.24272 Transcript_11819/m.24272 type:complete len:209 (-) Transcript_11819:1122-1748(-)